jgi:hypothetical protein
MTKRPLSITLISWLFVGVGVVGLAYHASEFNPQRPFEHDLLWGGFVRLLAIVGGGFMLRGSNWARWLLVAWLGFHVVLSIRHTPIQLAVHTLLFVVVLFFLFRARASAYFRSAPVRAQNPQQEDAPVS